MRNAKPFRSDVERPSPDLRSDRVRVVPLRCTVVRNELVLGVRCTVCRDSLLGTWRRVPVARHGVR